jgi:hypothetical protein
MSKLVLRNVKDVVLLSLLNVLIMGIIYFLFKFNDITYYKYGLYGISGLYLLVFFFAITSGVINYNTVCCAKAGFTTNSSTVGRKSFEGVSKYKLFNFEIRMISVFIVTALIGLIL